MNGVKARCKNCNGEAPADQFKLHHGFKMMVCPACYTGKNKTVKDAVGQREAGPAGLAEARESKPRPSEPLKPAGWDKEDEYLERAARMRKQQTQAQFAPVEGTEFVKYACQHCKYNFRYNPVKKIPATCPYCDFDIPRVKLSDIW